MNAEANIPNTRYEWQRPYLAAALETDAKLLPARIAEARRDIRRRLSDCPQIGEFEQSAVVDALNALATLEKERLRFVAGSGKNSTIVLDLADGQSESNAA